MRDMLKTLMSTCGRYARSLFGDDAQITDGCWLTTGGTAREEVMGMDDAAAMLERLQQGSPHRAS
jgi:hypothetical protein